MDKAFFLLAFLAVSAKSSDVFGDVTEDFPETFSQRIMKTYVPCNETYATVRLEENKYVELMTPNFPREDTDPYQCGYELKAPPRSKLAMMCSYIGIEGPDIMIIKNDGETERIRTEKKHYYYEFSKNYGEVEFRKRNRQADSAGFSCTAYVIPPPKDDCYCGYFHHDRKLERDGSSTAPWSAKLVKHSDNHTYVCSGTLINDRYIAVSLPCVFKKLLMGQRDQGKVSIYLGGYNHQYVEREPLELLKPFPEHHDRIGGGYLALGLVRIRPIRWRRYPYIRHICMPSSPLETYAGRIGFLLGWPRYNYSDHHPDMVVKGDSYHYRDLAFVFAQEQCSEIADVSYLPRELMCAIGHDQGSCLGYGGEAMSVKIGHSYEFAGMSIKKHCDPYYPIKMQRISEIYSWIHEVTHERANYCPRYYEKEH